MINKQSIMINLRYFKIKYTGNTVLNIYWVIKFETLSKIYIYIYIL